MERCVTCDQTFTLGRKKGSAARYCSPVCQFRDFFSKFTEALDRAAAANPDPLPDRGPSSKADVSPADEFGPAMVAEGSMDLIVIVLGLAVAAAVAVAIYGIVGLVKYPFHAQTVWFVIPLGAFFCGMAAGCGFWVGLRWLGRLPRKLTFVAALAGGALAYVLIDFVRWWMLEFQGMRIRDAIGFLEFLQLSIENQRTRIGRGPGPALELGKLGYARYAINLVGFALGVVAMVAFGGDKAYCPRCRRYLKRVGKQTRSSSDPEAVGNALHPVIVGVVSGRIQDALDLHASSGEPGGKEYWTTTIVVEACPGCGTHQATLTASVPGDNGPAPVEGFVFQGKSDHAVRLFL